MIIANAAEPRRVLLTTHHRLETLDLTGPLEVLAHAKHASTGSKVFDIKIAGVTPTVMTNQDFTFQRDLDLEEAYSTLSSFDVLIVPGGMSGPIVAGRTEPIGLIGAFAALNDGRERILMSVCTASLFLAEAGALRGLTATSHPIAYEQMQGYEGVTLLKQRYVVNKRNERGLQIVTAGGISAGLDASLWLVSSVVGEKEMDRVAGMLQYHKRDGVVL